LHHQLGDISPENSINNITPNLEQWMTFIIPIALLTYTMNSLTLVRAKHSKSPVKKKRLSLEFKYADHFSDIFILSATSYLISYRRHRSLHSSSNSQTKVSSKLPITHSPNRSNRDRLRSPSRPKEQAK